MKIKVINSLSAMQEVWQLSRPYLHIEDLPSDDELIKMNLPINQFKRFILHIKSSILFRDLIFSFRPISVWARSNRTIKFDYNNIFTALDESISIGIDEDIPELALSEVIACVQDGLKQDYAKKKLPWLTETEFCIDINYRMLVNVLYTFELHCNSLFKPFLKELITNKVLSYSDYSGSMKVDLYNKISISESEKSMDYGTHKLGSMYMIHTNIQGNLMAQFIRQHSATIKNGLWNLANDNLKELAAGNCSRNLDIIAYLDENQLRNLVSTRTCWFAQMDKEDNGSWSHVLKDYVKSLTTKEFLKQLPCNGICNNCKIKGDMIPRVKHTEVNPPCPLLIENPFIIDQRLNDYQSDSVIMEKWKSAKRFINFNPLNELNMIYSELNMESGTNVYMEDK